MTEHDFRYSLLNPQHTLTECRALAPGRYQVTGSGGSIKAGDTLLVTLKGSRELSMRLVIEKVRHLINPPGQWLAVAQGPAFRELEIRTGQVRCDACGKTQDIEFAVEGTQGAAAHVPAIEARLHELGWQSLAGRHLCPACRQEA
ncbi:hypothetical protein [Pseudomonas sp. NW5]|uniref:hypothetical protein n=1 Tax=Pseudomonas sp. NW5 TaxID=2934934 RepID=UPI0020217A39|nr:hypothetical protein [Pseudomonas sp. NW5]MCL7462327.1 hypothetical protein [Pseudomonas sp. NW5]